jgi:carbonic anhydrase
MTTVHPLFASCHHLHDDASTSLSRRRFIQLATLGGGATLLGLAQAETGHGAAPATQTAKHGTAPAAHTTEALLLSCMDYRLIDDIVKYMDSRGMTNQYDHVILAGASLGAVTNAFKDWNQTFWDHLKVAIDLHHINSVILMDHRDCGAYKVILKADFSKDPALEEGVHGKYLRELAQAIRKRYPKLEVEMLMMNLDGTVQTIT